MDSGFVGATGAVGGVPDQVSGMEVDGDADLEQWRVVLRESFDVFMFLMEHLDRAGLGQELRDHLILINAEPMVNAEWSQTWEGWAELVWRVRRLYELPEDRFIEEARVCVAAKLQHFLRIAPGLCEQLRVMSDKARIDQLKREGWKFGKGEVWGRNDCLADSLLQLLVERGLLRRGVLKDRGERDQACFMNRRQLELSRDAALRPRTVDGREGRNLYLEWDRHAGPTVEFLLQHFAAQRLVSS
jgi:hypothetical protein